MKISYIANIKLPTEKAHGIQTMKTCEAFANLGHDVELIVPNRKISISEEVFSYYGVKRNFKITKLWCVDTVERGFIGYVLEWFTFAEVVFWRELFMKKDLYFGRDYLSLFWLGILGRKTMWEAHTGEWNFLIWLYAKLGKKIITISSGLKKFYISKGVLEKNIVVSHDAVDTEQFEVSVNKVKIKEKLGIKTDLPICMYIGDLGLWKGVKTLLEASKELNGKVKIVIIGGYQSEVIPLKEKYKEILFLGYKNYKELPENQKVADILIVPNTGKDIISVKYTSPLKIFAHMVSNVPIIASDLPSIREILNEKNAYFTKPDSPVSLAERILFVLDNYEEAKSKSEKAKLDVREFTWDKRAGIILEAV